MSALADPTRRAIYEQVAQAPRAVGELADHLPVSRPAVSQHLKVLKEAGLVADHQAGSRRIYTADPNGLLPVRQYFEQFWRASLAAFSAAATTSTKEKA